MDKNSIAKKVKETLLEGLKQDGLKWFKPWKAGDNYPINNNSGRVYRGFNTFILNAEMRKGYEHNEWDTFKGISSREGKVIKGQKGTDVYLWLVSYIAKGGSNTWYKTKAECMRKEGVSEQDVIPNFNLRFYKVWNIGQCEGLKPRRLPAGNEIDIKPIESCEAIVSDYRAANPKLDISEIDQDQAFYRPSTDSITMPLKKQFDKVDRFYHTLFHEMVHSTGHESRLNRKGVAQTQVLRKTKHDYAFEELIAESGAMMLSGYAGICTDTELDEKQSQAYVNGWVKAVKQADEKAVISALTQSQKATDYILGK